MSFMIPFYAFRYMHILLIRKTPKKEPRRGKKAQYRKTAFPVNYIPTPETTCCFRAAPFMIPVHRMDRGNRYSDYTRI